MSKLDKIMVPPYPYHITQDFMCPTTLDMVQGYKLLDVMPRAIDLKPVQRWTNTNGVRGISFPGGIIWSCSPEGDCTESSHSHIVPGKPIKYMLERALPQKITKAQFEMMWERAPDPASK